MPFEGAPWIYVNLFYALCIETYGNFEKYLFTSEKYMSDDPLIWLLYTCLYILYVI